MRTYLSIFLLLLWSALPLSEAANPYAGEETRPIKALSQSELDGYLAGRGMGFAKAAELNGYPGPMHVLEFAGPLQLSMIQRERSEAVFERMRLEARTLGAQLVQKEGELDRVFADGRITAEGVDTMTAEVAEILGRLRAVHLRAHLAQRDILTEAQIDRYAQLRGYAFGHAAHGAHDRTH